LPRRPKAKRPAYFPVLVALRGRPQLHVERAINMYDTLQSYRSARLVLAYQRAQRKAFVCREIPTNKNVLPKNNLTKEQYVVMGLPEGILVYRDLPIDEKIDRPPCALCLCGEMSLLTYP
jgi:hypothetical protein